MERWIDGRADVWTDIQRDREIDRRIHILQRGSRVMRPVARIGVVTVQNLPPSSRPVM